jgi:HK97 family phage major capsid protein
MDIQEIKGALEASNKELGEKFARYESELKETGSVAASVRADLKSMSDDNAKLAKEVTTLSDQLTQIAQKGMKMEKPQRAESIGEQFVKSSAFQDYKSGKTSKAKLEIKNTILGEGGSPQEPTDVLVPKQYMAGIVGGAFRQLRILSLIPRGQASGNTVHYTRESSFVNRAAERSEAAQKPETDIVFEGVDTPVRTIAHFLKVSKQVMDDAPALQSYIDRRMTYGVTLRAEQQIINGNGTTPNLSGILASGNFTSLSASGGDTDFDFANRAKYEVIGADYMPDVYLINPADWGRMERLKTGLSGDDRYVGADGAINYLQNGLVPTLWGLPVIPSNSVPAGKLICLSLDATMFWERQGVTVEIFDQNEDDVEKNLLTVRGEMRGAFTVFRPDAVVAGDLPDYVSGT